MGLGFGIRVVLHHLLCNAVQRTGKESSMLSQLESNWDCKESTQLLWIFCEALCDDELVQRHLDKTSQPAPPLDANLEPCHHPFPWTCQPNTDVPSEETWKSHIIVSLYMSVSKNIMLHLRAAGKSLHSLTNSISGPNSSWFDFVSRILIKIAFLASGFATHGCNCEWSVTSAPHPFPLLAHTSRVWQCRGLFASMPLTRFHGVTFVEHGLFHVRVYDELMTKPLNSFSKICSSQFKTCSNYSCTRKNHTLSRKHLHRSILFFLQQHQANLEPNQIFHNCISEHWTSRCLCPVSGWSLAEVYANTPSISISSFLYLQTTIILATCHQLTNSN